MVLRELNINWNIVLDDIMVEVSDLLKYKKNHWQVEGKTIIPLFER